MKQKTNQILVLAASAGLMTRGIYTLLTSFIGMFQDYLFKEHPLRYVSGILSRVDMVLLCLGFCGFLLLWNEWGKKRELQNPIRFSQVKKITFSLLIFFLGLTLIRNIYWSIDGIRVYLVYLSKETAEGMSIPTLLWIILGELVFILERFGMIFFGFYILSQKQKFRKIILPLYLPGVVYTITILLYNMIRNYYTFSRSGSDVFVQFGTTKMMLLQMVSSGVIQILISVACLLVILYGLKQRKEETDRDQNAISGVDNLGNCGYTLEKS